MLAQVRAQTLTPLRPLRAGILHAGRETRARILDAAVSLRRGDVSAGGRAQRKRRE